MKVAFLELSSQYWEITPYIYYACGNCILFHTEFTQMQSKHACIIEGFMVVAAIFESRANMVDNTVFVGEFYVK